MEPRTRSEQGVARARPGEDLLLGMGDDCTGRHSIRTDMSTDALQELLGESVRLTRQHLEAVYRCVVESDAR